MISGVSDVDWFEFVAPNGDITVSLEDLPADYELELYQSETQRVGMSANGGTKNEIINYNVDDDYKTLYIRVYGYNGNCSINPYTLCRRVYAAVASGAGARAH